jgi:hypothetical protein
MPSPVPESILKRAGDGFLADEVLKPLRTPLAGDHIRHDPIPVVS